MKTDEQIVEQAIEWMLQLEQGDLPATERAAFERWKAADPRHSTAYANLTQSVRQFDVPRKVGAAPAILRNTLQQKSKRRKTLKRIAALAGLTVGAGALLDQFTPVGGLTADLHTSTGERRRTILADGSVVTLNARSSADHLILPSLRQIRLFAGEIQVQVAAQGALPFSIDTAHGSVSLPAGTLMLRYQELRTDIVALQAAPLLTTRNGARAELASGQRTWFDQDSIASPHQINGGENSWVDGYYTASDTPLAEVVAALRPYRKGILRLDPAVAQLRISGTFPLDDTDRVLSALASALPIAVTRVSPYWVSISSRA